MDKRNAKALMIDDGDYSTPQDHYFGYINKRVGESQNQREKNEENIYRKLQNQLDTQDPILNQFEPLMEAQQPIDFENALFSSQTGVPKHGKKDYSRIPDIGANKIVDFASFENKQKEYKQSTRSQFEDLVKIEQKRKENLKKKEKAKQKKEHKKKLQEQSREIEALRLPQAKGTDNTSKVMELVNSSNLTAVKPSQSDIERLESLKTKAMQKPATRVILKKPNQPEIDKIETNLDQMKTAGVFDQRISAAELRQVKAEVAGLDAAQKKATAGIKGGKITLEDMMQRPAKKLISRKMENDIDDFPKEQDRAHMNAQSQRA